MANQNQPSGFSPVRHRSGAPYTGSVSIYAIAAADTAAYWPGDPVSTMVASAGTPGADTWGIPNVTLWAGATVAVRGVIMALGINPQGGPYINPNNLTLTNRPSGANTAIYYAAVADDPDLVFEVQEAGAGSVLLAASVSRNVSINTGTRTGSRTFSPAYLDNNTVNTTVTLPVKILSAVQRSDNTPYTTFQKWLVMFNNHEFRAGTVSQ